MSLRPKYTLNKAAVQGSRYTINAIPFSQLTSRSYPYPRIGTRAPNGMFPRSDRPKFQLGNGLPLPTGHTAPKGYPGPLTPKFQLGNGLSLPTGHLAPRNIPGPLSPKFQLGNGSPRYDEGGPIFRMPHGYVEPETIAEAVFGRQKDEKSISLKHLNNLPEDWLLLLYLFETTYLLQEGG